MYPFQAFLTLCLHHVLFVCLPDSHESHRGALAVYSGCLGKLVLSCVVEQTEAGPCFPGACWQGLCDVEQWLLLLWYTQELRLFLTTEKEKTDSKSMIF